MGRFELTEVMVNKQKGSFTVEAALIMPVILGVIVMFIYIGMFMFDRCTIVYICQQASCAAVSKGDDIERSAEEYALNEISGRLLLDWDINIRAYSDERSVYTSIEAKNTRFGSTFTHTGRTDRHFCPKY